MDNDNSQGGGGGVFDKSQTHTNMHDCNKSIFTTQINYAILKYNYGEVKIALSRSHERNNNDERKANNNHMDDDSDSYMVDPIDVPLMYCIEANVNEFDELDNDNIDLENDDTMEVSRIQVILY